MAWHERRCFAGSLLRTGNDAECADWLIGYLCPRMRPDSRSVADMPITIGPYTLKDRGMAHRFPFVDDLLHLASTSRTRSVVTAAAVSFAVCHLVVLAS